MKVLVYDNEGKLLKAEEGDYIIAQVVQIEKGEMADKIALETFHGGSITPHILESVVAEGVISAIEGTTQEISKIAHEKNPNRESDLKRFKKDMLFSIVAKIIEKGREQFEDLESHKLREYEKSRVEHLLKILGNF